MKSLISINFLISFLWATAFCLEQFTGSSQGQYPFRERRRPGFGFRRRIRNSDSAPQRKKSVLQKRIHGFP